MGDIADYYADLELYCPEPIWTTRDGQRIPIVEMTDSHLMNTLRMLKRNAPQQLLKAQSVYILGPEPQGEMAQMAYEEEANRLFDMDPIEFMLSFPLFEALAVEAANRELISWEGLDD